MRVAVEPRPRPLINYQKFFGAVRRGDVETVKAMLDAGADIESIRNGGTPLVAAMYRHQTDVVKLLLERGADVNNPVEGLLPIFHAAARSEHAPELIQLLLDHGANLEATATDTHLSILHFAAGKGMIHATDFLISKGVDIHGRCKMGKTPLLFAAEKGHTEVVKLLYAKGADLDIRSWSGGTPLMWATSCGHVETVGFLLEKGARVEDCDEDGMTALLVASRAGFPEIVEMLLEKGANVNALSEKPRKATPAMVAAIEGHARVLETLIRHGADLSIPLDDKISILDATMKRKHFETTKILLEAIGGPDYPKDSVAVQIALTGNRAESRPLLACISTMYPQIRTVNAPVGKLDWIEWVLSEAGDLVRPTATRNLLHHAMQLGETDMIAELLRLGLDPNMTIFNGETPLHAAVNFHNKDIVRLLVNAGADPARPATNTEIPMVTPLLDALEHWNDDVNKDTSILDILLDTGRCKLMVGDEFESTAFAYVLHRFGRWEDRAAEKLALRMLESVPDVNNDRSDDGSTLMHAAVRFGETDLIDFLKNKGADMNPKDKWEHTPFLMACHGDPDIIDFLVLWGADVHAVDDGGRSALHIAASQGQVKILQLLLDLTGDNALDVDATDNLGHTALMSATGTGNEEAALYLLSRGASPHRRMDKDRTLLRFAAMRSMHRIADKILAEPESVDLINYLDEEGWTPLAAACIGPSPTIISKLLSHGANINTANPFNGETPLHIALKRPAKIAAQDAENNENPALTLLQDPNIDATARDTDLHTALHCAAAFKNLAAAKALLARPEVAALVNEVDAKGMTALCLCPVPEIAKLLIDHGADVNYADPNGWTPLHFAVDMGAVKTYKVLMDNGAEENARTKDDGLTVEERIKSLGGSRVWELNGYDSIKEDEKDRD